MIVTLQHFSRALLTPDLSLAMLADARPVTEPNGMPRLVRTTRFAEAEVEWRGERWLVAMPLNPSAMPRIERTVSALRKLNTGYLAECRILPGEMRWHDAAGTERHTDLVLQHLPAGREFAEALLAEDKATLLAALDTLAGGARGAGIHAQQPQGSEPPLAPGTVRPDTLLRCPNRSSGARHG